MMARPISLRKEIYSNSSRPSDFDHLRFRDLRHRKLSHLGMQFIPLTTTGCEGAPADQIFPSDGRHYD